MNEPMKQCKWSQCCSSKCMLWAILIFVLGVLLGVFVLDDVLEEVGYGEATIVINDTAEHHHQQMNACIAAGLAKHPGKVLEVEVEEEDNALIFDVDIQGDDGKNWEVECDIATTAIIEDKQEH